MKSVTAGDGEDGIGKDPDGNLRRRGVLRLGEIEPEVPTVEEGPLFQVGARPQGPARDVDLSARSGCDELAQAECIVRIKITVQSQADLLEIVDALGAAGRLARLPEPPGVVGRSRGQ